ncbi:MAG: hypothetical protein JNK23_04700 [Opitutaceae bacterium]|nr:hypothetical protein [Opitutaceae bacterium]
MNEASLLFIADAQRTLEATVTSGASDVLTAAFARWLDLSDVALPAVVDIAAQAVRNKGAARTYRDVAALGYCLSDPAVAPKLGANFHAMADWLMGRPLEMGGDPVPMLSDPVALLGMTFGVKQLPATNRSKLESWLAAVRAQSAALLQQAGWTGGLAHAIATHSVGEEGWVAAGLASRLPVIDTGIDLAAILREVIARAPVAEPAEAVLLLAALRWLKDRALTINVNAASITDTVRVLERVGSIFSRWVWEQKARRGSAEPVRWRIENEYHFQSLLFTVLKPLLPSLEEEQFLASTGQVQPRADLCLLSLSLLIEVKFWYRANAASRLIEEVAADVTLYLKSNAPYRELIVVIWDDGARTEEHDELKRGLGGLQGICGVVVINRPSRMVD